MSLQKTDIVCDDDELTSVNKKSKKKINHKNAENGETNNCTKKAAVSELQPFQLESGNH